MRFENQVAVVTGAGRGIGHAIAVRLANEGARVASVSRSAANAQFVIQPFYVPENTSRFSAPSGVLTHSFRWEPGRVLFRTSRGTDKESKTGTVAEHEFTSGVPTHGSESVRMTLYVFRAAKEPIQNDNEVVIEKFEFLP